VPSDTAYFDADEVKAEFKNGVVKITIPLAKRSRPRRSCWLRQNNFLGEEVAEPTCENTGAI
jgi:hypothetical protein